MDVIATSAHPSGAPSRDPSINTEQTFGWGTQARQEHNNGLRRQPARVQSTNPDRVARATQGVDQRIDHGNGLLTPRKANVFAKASNQDPGQVVQAGMMPGMGHVGGFADDNPVPAPPWGKLALGAAGAGLLLWLFMRQGSTADSGVDTVPPDR